MAGQYHCGDGLGFNHDLTLAPAGRFSFRSHGCMGSYGTAAGSATITGDVIALRPDHPPNGDGPPESLRVIRWGPRLYLIPDEKLVDFCNEVNQGREPRFSTFFLLRVGDADKPAPGVPVLPEPYAAYVLRQPIKGTLSCHDGVTGTVTLSAKDGLRPGMVLTARTTSKPWFTQVRVTAVSDHDATVVARFAGDKLPTAAVVTSRFFQTEP